MRKLFLFVLLAAAPLCATVPADVAGQADRIVANYRKIIVLTNNDSSLDAITRERVSILGQMLFQENIDQLADLGSTLPGHREQLAAFLDRLETDPDYHDADKLVFRDLLAKVSP